MPSLIVPEQSTRQKATAAIAKIEVKLYRPDDNTRWDAFVARSKNATFMLQRSYMDYHAHRFQDCSLIFSSDHDDIAALLPANRDGDSVVSHGGLSYGGVLSDEGMTTPLMLRIFDAMLEFYRTQGLTKLLYKAIPHIYHSLPAEEDLYALFRCGAKLVRRDVSSVVFPQREQLLRHGVRLGVRRAKKLGVEGRISEDYRQFWSVLQGALQARHGLLPVHTIDEITLLKARFPQCIKLFGSFIGEKMLAGMVIYESTRVAHTQYIAATEAGKRVGALQLLTQWLLTEHYPGKECWDFGHSNEEGGWRLNEGLISNKEGYGGRAVVYDQYEIDLQALSGNPSAALFRRVSE